MWGYPYFMIFCGAEEIFSLGLDAEIGQSLGRVSATKL
jgi:hypothetical protein